MLCWLLDQRRRLVLALVRDATEPESSCTVSTSLLGPACACSRVRDLGVLCCWRLACSWVSSSTVLATWSAPPRPGLGSSLSAPGTDCSPPEGGAVAPGRSWSSSIFVSRSPPSLGAGVAEGAAACPPTSSSSLPAGLSCGEGPTSVLPRPEGGALGLPGATAAAAAAPVAAEAAILCATTSAVTPCQSSTACTDPVCRRTPTQARGSWLGPGEGGWGPGRRLAAWAHADWRPLPPLPLPDRRGGREGRGDGLEASSGTNSKAPARLAWGTCTWDEGGGGGTWATSTSPCIHGLSAPEGSLRLLTGPRLPCTWMPWASSLAWPTAAAVAIFCRLWRSSWPAEACWPSSTCALAPACAAWRRKARARASTEPVASTAKGTKANRILSSSAVWGA